MAMSALTGMSYGMFLSTRAKDANSALQVYSNCNANSCGKLLRPQGALGSFLPLIIMSGVIWPLEGLSCVQIQQSFAHIHIRHADLVVDHFSGKLV